MAPLNIGGNSPPAGLPRPQQPNSVSAPQAPSLNPGVMHPSGSPGGTVFLDQFEAQSPMQSRPGMPQLLADGASQAMQAVSTALGTGAGTQAVTDSVLALVGQTVQGAQNCLSLTGAISPDPTTRTVCENIAQSVDGAQLLHFIDQGNIIDNSPIDPAIKAAFPRQDGGVCSAMVAEWISTNAQYQDSNKARGRFESIIADAFPRLIALQEEEMLKNDRRRVLIAERDSEAAALQQAQALLAQMTPAAAAQFELQHQLPQRRAAQNTRIGELRRLRDEVEEIKGGGAQYLDTVTEPISELQQRMQGPLDDGFYRLRFAPHQYPWNEDNAPGHVIGLLKNDTTSTYRLMDPNTGEWSARDKNALSGLVTAHIRELYSAGWFSNLFLGGFTAKDYTLARYPL